MESLALLVCLIVITTVVSGPLAILLAKYRYNLLAIFIGIVACVSGWNILVNMVTSFRLVGLIEIGLGVYSIYIVYNNCKK